MISFGQLVHAHPHTKTSILLLSVCGKLFKFSFNINLYFQRIVLCCSLPKFFEHYILHRHECNSSCNNFLVRVELCRCRNFPRRSSRARDSHSILRWPIEEKFCRILCRLHDTALQPYEAHVSSIRALNNNNNSHTTYTAYLHEI